MIVLGIILAIVVAVGVAVLIAKLDDIMSETYGYRFFTIEHFVMIFVAYLLIFFGHSWFVKALEASTDTLNGIVLMLIGAILIAVTFYRNIVNTSFAVGLSVSIVQLALYAVGSVFAFLALIMALAYFSDTKPVYTVN